jgi:hypothetical protein
MTTRCSQGSPGKYGRNGKNCRFIDLRTEEVIIDC